MKSISELLNEYKEWRKSVKEKRINRLAHELFQITEHDNMLWFTYNGELFCPCYLFTENNNKEYNGTTFLSLVRKLFIERNLRNE